MTLLHLVFETAMHMAIFNSEVQMKLSMVFWLLGLAGLVACLGVAGMTFFRSGPVAASPWVGIGLGVAFVFLALSRYFRSRE